MKSASRGIDLASRCKVALKISALSLSFLIFFELAWFLGLKAFTYGKIGPRYNLILMGSLGWPPTQKGLKFCAIGFKENWPGL